MIQTLQAKEMTAFQALTSSESNEWYTPLKYIEAARAVMGGIDLDPASNESAQQWIKAKQFYIKDDDGLHKPWYGRLWLNPPYGRKHHRCYSALSRRF